MNVKTLVTTAMASIALGVTAADKIITVEEGATYEFTQTDIDELNAMSATDTLYKRGDGTAHATTALASFKGIIRIEEGIWLVDQNGKGFFGTTAGATYVEKGAAIHVKAPSPENSCSFEGEHFYLAGTGPDGNGAFYNACGCDEMRMLTTYCTVELTDDAMISSRYRLDMWYYSSLKLNGHHLTYRCYDTGGVRTFGFTTSPFSLGASDVLTVNHAAMIIDPNSVMSAFEVAAGAKMILTNNAWWGTRNYVPFNQDVKPLELEIAGASMHTEVSGAAMPYAGNWGTNANSFAGPVTLRQTASVEGTGNGTPMTFGAISGSGTLSVSKSRLQLVAPNNTYTGKIVVDGTGAAIDKSGFRLWDGANMPPAESLKVKNAQLVLSDNDAVTLPSITVEGAAQFIGGPSTDPAVRSVAASLVKTGDGELYWDSALDVAGETSIEGGVLRLAKPKLGNPGLGEGRFQTTTDSSYPYFYNYSGSTSWKYAPLNGCKTIRREGPAAAFARAEWRYYTCPYYHGYVWNRTDEDVIWDVACVLGTYAYLYVDGKRFDGVSSGPGNMSAQGGACSYPITLTPGAHEVSFFFVDLKTRTDAQMKSIPGPTIGWYTEWWPWVDRGFAYDPNGSSGGVAQSWDAATGMAYALEHFVPFKDPGDGSLFTLDNKTTAEIDQRGYHPGFSNLVVKAGAAIDLNGNDLAVGRIGMGTGVISNGTLTVKGGFAFSTATLGEGPTVKGDVTLADGATVELDDSVWVRSNSYTLLTVEGDINGTVAVDQSKHPGWGVRKSKVGDVSTLQLVCQRGMIIIFR